MDDIELLLPGLKVSSGLIRHRPLSPNSESERSSVGSKRRHQEQWGSETDEVDSSASKRYQATCVKRLPRRLRLEPAASPTLDSNPALLCLEAGITSSMLSELDESPRLPTATISPHDDEACRPSQAWTPRHFQALDAREQQVAAADIRTLSGPSLSAPATCPSSAPNSTVMREADLGAASAISPDSFHKTKSVPSRLEPNSLSLAQRTQHKALSHPSTRESSPGPEVMSPDSSLPPLARANMTRAEKWQERISAATLRLRARSLPVTPQRPRAQASVAQSCN